LRSLLGDLLAQRLAALSGGTLNKRLYDALQAAIQDGSIATATRLPASRDLARELAVSRNTVLAVYEQLQSEGYLQTRTGSGTFVSAVMSLQRRHELLERAKRSGSWVVEDDYDGEFRFSGSPMPELQGLAADAPVIYLGTFSKTLYPGIRLSYMVVPKSMATRMKMAHSELYRGGYGLVQLTLAAFIREGHYAAHVRRMRQIYSRRRAALVAVISQSLGADWIVHHSNAGLHLVLRLPDSIDDVAFSAELEQCGVLTRPLSSYYLQGTPQRGLLLGYACVDEADIPSAFAPVLARLEHHLQIASISP